MPGICISAHLLFALPTSVAPAVAVAVDPLVVIKSYFDYQPPWPFVAAASLDVFVIASAADSAAVNLSVAVAVLLAYHQLLVASGLLVQFAVLAALLAVVAAVAVAVVELASWHSAGKQKIEPAWQDSFAWVSVWAVVSDHLRTGLRSSASAAFVEDSSYLAASAWQCRDWKPWD